MTDIVERVRWLASGQDDPQSQELIACANEIERLREALREIAEGDRPDNDKQFCVGYWGATARAALEEGKE